MVLIEWAATLGLDVAREKITKKIDESKLKQNLGEYLERQAKINDLSDLASEIDFQGLKDYVHANMMEDIQTRLFGNRKERENSRNNIRKKAIAFAHANNKPQAVEKAVKLVTDVIDMLYKYHFDQISKNDLLLAAQVTDDISLLIDKSTKALKAEIRSLDNNSYFSIDSVKKMMMDGNIVSAEKILGSYLDIISDVHPLSPYYQSMFDTSLNKLKSVPKNNDALIKYPPKINVSGTVQLGDKYVQLFDKNLINYANKNQLTITLNIHAARKLLGDNPDPYQAEAEQLLGRQIIIPPKPFPEFCCNIILDDGTVVIDYLNLRIERVLDDDTFIVTNTDQKNCPILFTFTIRTNAAHFEIKYKVRTEMIMSASARLYFLRFLKKLYLSKNISVKLLSKNIILAKGNLVTTDISSIDKEIIMLEQIETIQNYYKRQISMPSMICETDLEIINYVSLMVRGECCEIEWSECKTSIVVSENTKKVLKAMKQNSVILLMLEH